MKVAIVTEIRDSIEIVHSVEYSRFLQNILTAFIHLLYSVPPSFVADSDDHVFIRCLIKETKEHHLGDHSSISILGSPQELRKGTHGGPHESLICRQRGKRCDLSKDRRGSP